MLADLRRYAPIGMLVSLLLAASLLEAALAPPAVRAAGGEIRVVQTQQQVNYPSGVALSIEVEAEAEIAEVRVYYRAAGSRQWGYAYADFDPGTRVVATQSVPVSESTYIAPGADVEYYFRVRDVAGNTVQTDSAVVEYLDARFDWQRVSIGPLELVYHDISDAQVQDAAQALRQDLARVLEILQLESVRGFKGVIYNSYADANAAFPVTSQTTTDQGTFAGYAFPEQRVFVGQGLDRRIIVHESAHLILRDSLGRRNARLPAWLNEGFATYMEPNVRVRGSGELYRRTPHLKAMKSLSGTPETIPLFYQKSVSVVAHLIEVYGEARFRMLLDELAKGRGLEVALVTVYGFDDHGLDSSWAGLPIPDPVIQAPAQATAPSEPGQSGTDDADAPATGGSQPLTATDDPPGQPETQGQPDGQTANGQTGSPANPPQENAQPQAPGQESGPSPFVFFDVWILAGVALLAVAVVTGKFVYNRLRQRAETDAELDPLRGYYIDED